MILVSPSIALFRGATSYMKIIAAKVSVIFYFLRNRKVHKYLWFYACV